MKHGDDSILKILVPKEYEIKGNFENNELIHG